MHHPEELKYSRSHEWVRREGDRVRIGITDHAQSELGDIVYLELPEAGRILQQEDVFGSVESVKAVSDLISPISGAVLEVNDALIDQPETLNQDPYQSGWLLVVKPSDVREIDALLDAAGYEQFLEAG
ncbi:MAG: glycine cleavage system protein GcvH [Armatimonadetes bacterium]|nr:glycine cleavage system protein GcvH [Armatimonadota bacterium]